MNNQKKTVQHTDRESIRNVNSKQPAEKKAKEATFQDEASTDLTEENRAELNGKKGNITTERTQPTGEVSALPGAEEKEIGTAAAGAGLGGNKGTGTSDKKSLD